MSSRVDGSPRIAASGAVARWQSAKNMSAERQTEIAAVTATEWRLILALFRRDWSADWIRKNSICHYNVVGGKRETNL